MVKVTVFSTISCPWCRRVKEFLKVNKIVFTNVDVGSDQKAAKEMVKKSGQTGVPVIDIDGKIVVGFDEEKLRSLLKIE